MTTIQNGQISLEIVFCHKNLGIGSDVSITKSIIIPFCMVKTVTPQIKSLNWNITTHCEPLVNSIIFICHLSFAAHIP